MLVRRWQAHRTYARLVALGAALSACGPDEDSARRGAAMEVDTIGGVEHVTHVGDVGVISAAGWRVDSARAVEIGTVEGADPYVFGQISGVLVGVDGRIYVADDQAKEVRIFTAAGEFVDRFGRAGEGPGEFRNLGGIGRAADGAIAVVDGALGRTSVFSPEGEFRRSFRLERPYRIIRHDVPVRFDSDGRYYDVTPLSRTAPVDSTGVVRYAPDGTVEETTLLWAYEPRQVTILDEGRPMASLSIPFAPRPSAAIDSRGRVYTARGGEYRIAMAGPTGDTLRVVRRAVEDVPVGAASRDSARAALVERYTQIAGAPPRDLPPLPENLPSILALRVDELDHLWVLRAADGERPGMVWDVFSPDGALLGEVRHPAMHVMHIGERTIAGVAYDEMQVPKVIVLQRR